MPHPNRKGCDGGGTSGFDSVTSHATGRQASTAPQPRRGRFRCYPVGPLFGISTRIIVPRPRDCPPPMSSREYQEILAAWNANAVNRPAALTLAQLREWMSAPTEPAPGTATIQPVNAGGVPAEWVCGPAADPDRRLLYLHGGGYVSGGAACYREFTAVLSNATGCAVLATDYRLGPEHPFPAAVEDAVAAYCWMRAHGPAGEHPAPRTFIAGDSAGGGLTLAALLALRDA
ncbi:alpha/beta hydrolase fold domain-containing protein, partial [bacterium]|nr:alpha/beta hydrolase fold domain-containing protein [bacterium]